jgi:hypothetical protein
LQLKEEGRDKSPEWKLGMSNNLPCDIQPLVLDSLWVTRGCHVVGKKDGKSNYKERGRHRSGMILWVWSLSHGRCWRLLAKSVPCSICVLD